MSERTNERNGNNVYECVCVVIALARTYIHNNKKQNSSERASSIAAAILRGFSFVGKAPRRCQIAICSGLGESAFFGEMRITPREGGAIKKKESGCGSLLQFCFHIALLGGASQEN